ncbi:MAG TPA: glycosyltransferase family 4 protein [Oculatellaceae cyanobacterium]
MTADTVGGVWTYALELAAALGEHGIEVALATMGAPLTPQQREASRQLPNLEVFESRFKLEWMEDAWEDVRKTGEWLLQLEKRLQPDIVHLNGYVHAALPWQAPTLVVGHSCVLSWWEAVKGEPAPFSWDRYRQEVRRGLQAANLVIAPSAAMLKSLNSHYGEFVNEKVIPNGRDSTIFCPLEKKEFVLTAGRLWDEAKNISALKDIAPQLLWPIYMAGEDKHPERRRGGEGVRGGGGESGGTPSNRSINRSIDPKFNQVENTKICTVRPYFHPLDLLEFSPPHPLTPSPPHLLGLLSTEELASWYARAAIYALPARYEPFGLSVLEAALSGCALVLGDIASLREIWGDAAVFVPPDDGNAIASAINTLITDLPRRHQLAEKARTRALEFTPQRMVSGYLEAYQDLIDQRL